MNITNVRVYGLNESIKASKYPMSVDTNACTDTVTKTVKTLAQSGTGEGHDNFLNGVIVQFDLTFSLKAWTEAQRYHFLDFVSSQSTMHRIARFDIKSQCNQYVDKRIIQILEEKTAVYNKMLKAKETYKGDMSDQDYDKMLADAYLDILYNIPTGFELTARMTTNYRQLKTIYYQRRNHRLPEWRAFCEWVETLPMFKELILGVDDNNN